jgi:peptidyl-prolyl cis-trans isomerase B (cyclophilin B)
MRLFIKVLNYVMMLAVMNIALAEEGGTMPTTSNTVLVKTNKGDITIVLDAEKAPVTVQNFLEYTQQGFYNGTIFHRVIPGFMIQGGGFDKDFIQKKTNAPIKNEAANGLKNKRGSIAMARTQDPNSATGQFFINLVDNDSLNYRSATPAGYGYAVFGEVTSGMEVVDAIAKVKTDNRNGHQNVPVDNVVIESVTLVP